MKKSIGTEVGNEVAQPARTSGPQTRGPDFNYKVGNITLIPYKKWYHSPRRVRRR